MVIEGSTNCWSVPTPAGGSLLRKHHTAVPFRDEIVIFGGVCKEPDKAGQFLIYNQAANRIHTYFTRAADPKKGVPPCRSGHCAALVNISQKLLTPSDRLDDCSESVEGLLVVGGWSGQRIGTVENDVWFLDILSCIWHKPVSIDDIPGKSNFCSLVPVRNNEVALFRGGDGVAYHSELYFYDLLTGRWTRKDTSDRSKFGCDSPK